jgi:prepilin-type N-terminal cleavage/methylation domain-containing protein
MHPKTRGYTLVEILFVAAIIALLSVAVYANIDRMRMKAYDAQRVSDLQMLQIALKLYRDSYGTYLVNQPNPTGENDTGTGWVSYTGGVYTTSITKGLYDQGLIPQEEMLDPTLGAEGYALFLCNSGKTYGLFARKQRPTTEETAAMADLCGATEAAAAPYNMNYGVGG